MRAVLLIFPKMKIYVINLDRSFERLQNMAQLLNKMGLSFVRVPAVDGNLIEAQSFCSTPNWRYPYVMTNGEIGCFLSHRRCWESLVESGEEWALILEDDCLFSDRARNYMSSTSWIPNGVDIVQLFHTQHLTVYKETLEIQSNQLLKLRASSPVGAFAYLISRRAAQRALDLSVTVDGPVDNFLHGDFFPLSQSYPTWRLKFGVVRVDDKTTTIEGRSQKNRMMNKYRLHPQRLLKKLCLKIKKCFLVHYHQVWLS